MFLAPKQSEMTALSPAAGLPAGSCEWGRAGSQPDQEGYLLLASSGAWAGGRFGASSEPQPRGHAHRLHMRPCMSTTAGAGRPALGRAPVPPLGRPHGKPGSQPGGVGPSTPRAGFHSSCLEETIQHGKFKASLRAFWFCRPSSGDGPWRGMGPGGGRPTGAACPGSVHVGVRGAPQSCWG